MKKMNRKQGIRIVLTCLLIGAFLMVAGSNIMAGDQISPKEAVSMTKKVIEIVNTNGKAGLEELRGDKFVHGWVYPVVVDFSGKVLLHPIKPKLEGRSLLAMKDKNGKLFVAELISLAREKGSGWVEYVWPKPGEKKFSQKVSYALKGNMNGVDVLCIVGLYDVSKEFCEKDA